MRLSAKHEPKINIIWSNQFNNAHLPGVTVGIGVTIEPFNEDELFGRCVLLVKGYRVLDSAFI